MTTQPISEERIPMPFKSPAGQVRYLAAYDATLGLWPVPFEQMDILTAFGATHVIACGPKNARPLVLLHGFGFSATQWYPNVPSLYRDFRIYAVDVIDQYGKSLATRPVQTRENYAAWLGQVLDELGVRQALIAGHSYGGWLAANFALAHPERVSRLALISPAETFVPIKREFYLRGMAAGMFPFDFLIYSLVQWMTTLRGVRGEAVVEQFAAGMKYYRLDRERTPGFPTVFTDEELRGLVMPVLLLIGEQEVIYRPAAAFERARRLVPDLECVEIPGGGHAAPLDQPEATNAALAAFLCK